MCYTRFVVGLLVVVFGTNTLSHHLFNVPTFDVGTDVGAAVETAVDGLAVGLSIVSFVDNCNIGSKVSTIVDFESGSNF